MQRNLEVISSITQYGPTDPADGSKELVNAAQRAETDGVDSLLIGYTASRPDGWAMASFALAGTESIRMLLAHRPGIMSPVLAARMAATVDVLSGGRLSFNIVAGGSIGDQMREGDFLEHDQRYERATEYVSIMKQLWTTEEPINHEGKYYRLLKSLCQLKPLQKPHVPIYMGGASDAASKFALGHADAYMSWSEPVDMVRERFDRVREMFLEAGKTPPRFSVSMRLIIGDTEDNAWAGAEAMLPDDLEERRKRSLHKEDVGRNRQLGLAKDSLVHDERLWMGLAAATGGQGSTGALVGTADQVQDSLVRYVEEAGADTLLLTGPNGEYTPFPDGFLAGLRVKADSVLAARRT